MNTLLRILKMASIMDDNGEDISKIEAYCNSLIKKHAKPICKNLDYGESPFFGSSAEFINKYPGGIKDWLEWRKAEYTPTPEDLEYAEEPSTEEEKEKAKEYIEKAIEMGLFTPEELKILVDDRANEIKKDVFSNADDSSLREELADLEHKQWAHWTKYMLDNLTDENIEKWKEQCKTPYSDLSSKEKDSDREWADKVLKVINKDKK